MRDDGQARAAWWPWCPGPRERLPAACRSPSQHVAGARVADGRGRLQVAGFARHDRIQLGQQGGIELLASTRRWLAGQVGAGRYQRPAKPAAEFDHGRMRADPHRHPRVTAGNPARHAGGGGDDPGMRPRPRGEHGLAARVRQGGPVEEAVELVRAGRDEDQPLVDRSLLDGQQAQHGGLVERIAAQAPDRLGGVSDDAAASQGGNGGGEVGAHGRAKGRPSCRSGFSRDSAIDARRPIRSQLKPRLRRSGQASVLAAAVFFAAAFLATVFLVVFLAVFLVAFLAVFLAGAFFAATFFTTFLAGAFFAAAFLPKRPRAGLPVSSSSLVTSSSVSEAGSRSLGILPLSWPLLMYGP